jgi:hypothetical protein
MDNTPGEIIVTLANTEKHYSYEQLGVGFESNDQEVLSALQPVLLEEEGFDITQGQTDGYYTIKRVNDSQNTYVFPKSTAGAL